jgi:hypothetical protein
MRARSDLLHRILYTTTDYNIGIFKSAEALPRPLGDTQSSLAEPTHQLLVGDCCCLPGFNLAITFKRQLHSLLLALAGAKRITQGLPKRSRKERFSFAGSRIASASN